MKKAGALIVLVAGLTGVSFAYAAEGDPGSQEAPEEEVQLVSYRRDTLGGHFLLSGRGSFVAPFGRVSEDVDSTERSGNAFGLGLHIGYGLDRNVSIGAYGELELHGGSKRCEGCSATGYAAGLEIQYHLAQGLRLDPWVSYGAGFRGLHSDVDSANLNYRGLEWLRISMGADWFALSQFGIGPFAQFGAASMFKRPSGEFLGGTSWRFLMGLNIVLDLPGK